jgi:hypothetical protein
VKSFPREGFGCEARLGDVPAHDDEAGVVVLPGETAVVLGAPDLADVLSGEPMDQPSPEPRTIRFGEFEADLHHAMHHIGAAYSVMGEADEALEWLERSAADGFRSYPHFAQDTDLAPLAGGPRFPAFLARLKERWEHYRRPL